MSARPEPPGGGISPSAHTGVEVGPDGAHGKRRRGADGGNAGHALELFEKATVVAARFCAAIVLVVVEGDGKHDDPLRAETGIHRRESGEALGQETGRGEEHDRHGNL